MTYEKNRLNTQVHHCVLLWMLSYCVKLQVKHTIVEEEDVKKMRLYNSSIFNIVTVRYNNVCLLKGS